MNGDGDGPPGRSSGEARGFPAPPGGLAWLGLGPEVRVWRSRRWDYVMGLLGLLMLVSNGFSAASGLSPLSWLTAVVGLELALLALSDLLVYRGAARVAVALRVVALLGFAGVLAGWAWAATGSLLAALALVFGGACALLALLLWWARSAEGGP